MSEYKVSFGKLARTINYKDSCGELLFTFDVGQDEKVVEKKWITILERDLAETKRINEIKDEKARKAEKVRFEVAFERVKKYLLSCGYKVEVWPDNTNTLFD